MQRETELPQPGRVVHVAGRVTDEVFSFLGPATHALARAGRDQAVVMIDELRFRHHVASLHGSAELKLVPRWRNPLLQWRAMRKACREALESGPLHAVHLHGVLPGLVGAQAMREARVSAPLFFSPHGSRAMGVLRGFGAAVPMLIRLLLRSASSAVIVNVRQESGAFAGWSSAQLVESPVSKLFFDAPRNEARHPLIVTGGRSQSPRNAELIAQLAVLLSGEDLRIGFNWIGTVDPVSRVRLNAAGVGVFDAVTDAECVSRLSTGWIYLAPGATRGFPVFLAEAMAAGVPCVAHDCLQHRELIRDGETGFLCKTEREMIERIAALIDNPGLRATVGRAAREQASQRFGETKFRNLLLAAYEVDL